MDARRFKTGFSAVACAAIVCGNALAQSSVAPLEPSIVCRTQLGYDLMPERLQKAKQLGCRHVTFVYTVNCEIDEEDRVIGYGLRSQWPTKPTESRQGKWRPMTDELLAEMKQYYASGIEQAAAAKLRVAILCHLDVGKGRYAWRNYFRFDPLAKLNGYSYLDVMIAPLIEAIQQNVPPNVPVELAIAGEMGQSVFAHADSYAAMIAKIKESLPDNKVEIGISFNFNNVVGLRDSTGTSTFTDEQNQGVQELLDICDFVGFSNYHAVSVPPKAEDFRNSIEAFAADLAKHDVQLREATRLHFSEVGIGGYGPEGFTTDPKEAAKSPYNGPGRDRRNPWQDQPMRDFRVAYHKALLHFLAEQGAAWPVDVAYLWTDSAWDPQGIDEPDYADEEIIRMIQEHNRQAER